MKTNIKLSIIGWLLGCLGGLHVEAQTGEGKSVEEIKKDIQEIIIRKKGNKDAKFTLEISNDKILINGKPLAEFNENGISINNRKILIKEGNAIKLELSGTQNEIENGMKEFEKSLNGMEPEDIESISIINGDEIKNLGAKPYVFLGVSTENNTDGAKIMSVVDESPAKKAGLQKDDIIYKINDKKINGSAELSDVVKSMKANDNVKIYFIRDGKSKDVKATLSETKGRLSKTITIVTKDGRTKSLTMPDVQRVPAFPRMDFPNDFNGSMTGKFKFESRPKLGLKLQDTEEENGVKILEVETGSPSATAGLLKNDLIIEIGNVKVKNTDDAREAFMENRDKSSYSMKAKRNGNEIIVNIKIPKKLEIEDF